MNTITTCLLLATALTLAAACSGGSTRDLDAASQDWATYRHPAAGFSMQLPAALRAEEDGLGVICRYDGGVPVLVRLSTAEEAAGRGAWFGHEAEGPITLDGREGRRIIYDHWDGPWATRTIAYVVPQGERFLALEFRTPRELDAVQRRILASFRLQ